jgi:hypothetical protein
LVFLTDFVHARAVEVCLQRGALAYLRKGEPVEALAIKLQEVVGDGTRSVPAMERGDAPQEAQGPAGSAPADACPGGEPSPEPAGSQARSEGGPAEAVPDARRRRSCKLLAAGLVVAGTLAAGLSAAVFAEGWQGWTSPVPAVAPALEQVAGPLGAAPSAVTAGRPHPAASAPEPPPSHPDTNGGDGVRRPTATRPVARAAGVIPAVEVEEVPVLRLAPPRAAPDPALRLVEQFSLTIPPGAALDRPNSDVRPADERGAPSGGRPPRVLTFRTASTLDEVLSFYRSAGISFGRRVVSMGGRFQGIQRTVARSTVELPGGREATITVSHPGIDLVGRALVEDTSVRIDVRE